MPGASFPAPSDLLRYSFTCPKGHPSRLPLAWQLAGRSISLLSGFGVT